jgi:hypothetical protein
MSGGLVNANVSLWRPLPERLYTNASVQFVNGIVTVPPIDADPFDLIDEITYEIAITLLLLCSFKSKDVKVMQVDNSNKLTNPTSP